MVENQFNSTIKTIRFDTGYEFLSSQMQAFLHDKGIFHQRSCVNRPQQNGVVERKHRHRLEKARALCFQVGLLLTFWGEGVLTTTYLINRLSFPILQGKSAYETLFNSKPAYNHFCVLGCLCFAHTKTIDKFAPRAKKCVFIGYPYGKKGYKVYDLEKLFYVSTDVTFHENKFPFLTNKVVDASHNSVTPIPLPIIEDVSLELTRLTTADTPLDHHHTPTTEQQPTTPYVLSLEPSNDLSCKSCPPPSDQPLPPLVTNGPSSAFEHTTSIQQPTRRSSHPYRPSSWLVDYKCAHVTSSSTTNHSTSASHHSGTEHPLTHYISYDKFSTPHRAGLAAITTNQEPRTFTSASKDPRRRDAMTAEIKALEANNTWYVTPLNPKNML
ncbi:uncharacterized protein LOC105421830 [Amborella trichopoda]|uniref:uncharacterized protein LOC105421830 n=1 Tax=Amborella trichopoda TaxID=13333 RepID=UPI0005D3B09B|nr:uncharacterized protein LOC105421830 [Amborella trichopoda]|eukprot:XP_011629077.1 uncharacterized protein LOC105421830 [Amborella trichopoda]